jgi:hypothetical protein
MRKVLLFLAVTGLLAFPVAAGASTPRKAASASCKAQLKASGEANFDAMYKSMGTCISKMQKTTPAQRQSLLRAETTCRSAQKADPTAFESKYGTNTKGKSGKAGSQENAFGKCVSQTASA